MLATGVIPWERYFGSNQLLHNTERFSLLNLQLHWKESRLLSKTAAMTGSRWFIGLCYAQNNFYCDCFRTDSEEIV